MHRLKARLAQLRTGVGDAGMTTAEYAIGTLAAVGLAGVLFKVVTSDGIRGALTNVIEGALK